VLPSWVAKMVARNGRMLTPDELEGRLTALQLALAIALEGRRLNPEYAQAAAPN